MLKIKTKAKLGKLRYYMIPPVQPCTFLFHGKTSKEIKYAKVKVKIQRTQFLP